MKHRNLILSILTFFAACSHPAAPVFEELTAKQTGIQFSNIPSSRDSLNILDYLYYYNGGGVAVGDINNDGLPDIYFTANNKGGNKLFLNKGNFQFEDITTQAGVQGDADWSAGVTMADVNGDGKLDIYVCAISGKLGLRGHNMLFINQGKNKFSEQSNQYGLDFAGYSTQAAFFDYDRDGDLDCYLLNQSSHSVETYGDTTLRRTPNPLAGDKLFRNDNTNHFTDVTAASGIYTSALGYGLGISVADLNNDGWDDIYVGNDFHENDYYYINNHNGTFTESGAQHFNHYSRFSMGNDIADYNNDGQPDIVTADMLPPDEKVLKTYSSGEQADTYKYAILDHGYQPQYSRNALHVNLGDGKAFSEQALMAGISATDWSWSPLLADFDNDGIKDLFISNGIVRRPVDLDYMRFISTSLVSRELSTSNRLDSVALARMPEGKAHSYFFQGNANGRFTDLSTAWAMTGQHCSNGAAYADLDNDGKLDLVVNRLYENAAIYRNSSNTGQTAKSFLTLSFNGQKPNTFGIGVKAYTFHQGKIQYQQLMLTRGFQSSTEPRLHFGLDTVTKLDSLLIIWPNQQYQLLTNIKTNQPITADQVNAKDSFQYTQFFPKQPPLFRDITDSIHLNWRHKEDGFYDYARQYFIPHQLSTRGPKIAVDDVNKDGLDDIFLCGAKGQGGSLYIQQPNGQWQYSDTTLFPADRGDDQVDALFVDVNGDGAPDLYVAHGGNEDTPEQPGLLDKLYINDAKGHFTYAENALPLLPGNKSSVTAADIDHDGDQDLFVSICADPDAYGIPQDSYLLINDGKGNFNTIIPFKALGMVTAAGFADLNADGWPDLITVGEWMQPKIFLNNKGVFKESSQNLPRGLWQSLLLTDLDGDGHIDLIAGNYGLNSKLHASKDAPLKLYIKDFTGSHTLQQVLTYTTVEGEFTFLGKDELEKKLPWIKKTFLSYTDFAGKTVQQVFGDALNDLQPLQVTSLATTWFRNDGKGSLTPQPLPEAAQFSPTFAMAKLGSNQSPYLLIGGNFSSVLPYEGRYDANWGTILQLQNNSFQSLSPATTGFLTRGDVRDIKKIRTPKGPCYIVARNNERPLFFSPNK